MENLLPPELDWLVQGLLACLALGLVLGALVGVVLLVQPGWVFAVNERWSRWVDTQGQFRALDKPRSVERWFYRRHRFAGSLITLGALFVLWAWMFAYDRHGLFAMLGPQWQRPELNWMVSAGEWVVVLLHVAILAFGVIVTLRPSLLKQLETGSNRWHEADVSAALDRSFSPIERAMKVHPRVAGLLLLVVAGWSLAGIVPVLQKALT